MQLASATTLVFITLFCSVLCQWVQFRDDADLRNITGELLASDAVWSAYHTSQRQVPVQFIPAASPVSRALTPSQFDNTARRTQRQAYYSKNSNFGGGAFSWSHYFTIPPVYSSTKESAYIREENMKRLKNMLEKDTVFQFLNPSGLRISIPADNNNIRIENFRFKVNEEFRGNDGGHYAPTSYKRGGLWTYDIPEVQVQQGDKVYYLMNVKFIKEGTDVLVQGVLEITRGNPHVVISNQIPFRPTTSPVISPQQQQPSFGGGGGVAPTVGGGYGGGTRGAFIWNHQFTINATYSSGFSQSAANSWLQQAEIVKNSVQNIDFQFSNPTGLTISIPDNSVMKIEDFRLKINEEFRSNDGGHFAPISFTRGNLVSYNIPELKANQGDRIFYQLRIKLGKEEYDTIVRGVLAISQGNPHKGANGVMKFPSYSRPQLINNSPSVGGGLGGNKRGQQAVRWEHRFTINTTYNAAFTEESANRWFDEAQLFKNTLERDMEFQFLSPTGLSISITGDTDDVQVLAFNIKLNEEFRTLGPGNYVPNISRMADGRRNYYYPNLKLNQGDKVYYWMRVTLGKQGFDNIIKGVLDVKQGDPHIGGPVPSLPAPTYVGQQQSPPNPPNSQYPNQNPQPSRPGQYPSQEPVDRYPQQQPASPYPPPSLPSQYPKPSPPSQYPKPSTPSQYPKPSPPKPSPPSQYPPPSPPSQYNPPPNQYPTPSPPNQYTPPPSQYPPPQSPSQATQECGTSVTTANKAGDTTPPCQGQTLFDPKFNNLDNWVHQISIGGKNTEDEFTCFTKHDENSWVQQGRLHIKPTLLEERSNETFVRTGQLFLPGCTLSNLGPQYCHRKGNGFNILPPIDSARINTQNMISFRYGTVEIRAKLPQGDWLAPELWLVPVNQYLDEKIVMGLATGNAGKTANQMSAGVMRETDKRLTLMSITGSTPWYQGFHNFKMEWTPDNVKFFVDNQQIHELTTDSFTVLKQEVYISLGVHAGGYRDFPDESYTSKPWKNTEVKRLSVFWDAKDVWYKSWKDDAAMQIEYIRVKAL